jgi:hypothetical protein
VGDAGKIMGKKARFSANGKFPCMFAYLASWLTVRDADDVCMHPARLENEKVGSLSLVEEKDIFGSNRVYMDRNYLTCRSEEKKNRRGKRAISAIVCRERRACDQLFEFQTGKWLNSENQNKQDGACTLWTMNRMRTPS